MDGVGLLAWTLAIVGAVFLWRWFRKDSQW